MFKVVLVDDEPWALLGMVNSFEWGQWGFEVIAKTTDPEEAAEIIRREKPDVVFTDICMQEHSGIDLIKAARADGQDTEFVIVSGYGEFSYAQDAIRYGTFYYMLKPIDLAEAEKLIEKLSKHMTLKKSIEERISDISILESIYAGNETIREFFERNKIPVKYPTFQVVVTSGISYCDPARIEIPDDSVHITLKLGTLKYAFLVNCKDNLQGDIFNFYSKEEREGISIGLSTCGSDSRKVSSLLREADMSSFGEFIYANKGVFLYEKNSHGSVKNMVDKVITYIEESRVQSVKEIIYKVPEAFIRDKLGMEEITLFYNQIVAYIAYEYNEAFERADLGFLDYAQLVKKFVNIHDLCSFLADIVSLANAEACGAEDVNVNDNFKNLLNYVNTNYNQIIYLSDLSKKFYLNSTYICDLFKKVTKMTFTEYLTQLRMEKACEFLNNTEISISEIAEKVGYKDYYHFSRTFKKAYGITPSNYKKGS